MTVIGVTAIAALQHRKFRRQRQEAVVLDLTRVVQDLVGGIVAVMWRKLEPWVTQLRVEQSCPSDSEWFQWLAEQLERRKAEKVPACLRHRDWSP
jgi:hypothetical protein